MCGVALRAIFKVLLDEKKNVMVLVLSRAVDYTFSPIFRNMRQKRIVIKLERGDTKQDTATRETQGVMNSRS